ncbi:MAG: hypothetical protein H0T17_10430 [Propionibacteriales bacterium]|nr:hypothetical protein [Propionibacteriales bacterium]
MSTDYPSYPDESARAEPTAHDAGTQQPPSIRTAVTLMRVGAVISALSLIVGLLTLGALKDEVRLQLDDSGTNFSQSDLDAAFKVAVAVIIILGLIGVALWLWMASANGKGKKWARVVATILAVMNVLSLLYALSAGTQTVVSTLLGIASVLVGVAAAVFLYRSDATQYYDANSRR